MGVLDEILASDGEALVDTDAFGESVTYVKKDGTTRSVKAVVFRQVPNVPAELPNPGHLVPVCEIEVRNDTTYGIATSEVDLGADKVQLSKRVDGSTESLRFGQIVEQDQGTVRYRLK